MCKAYFVRWEFCGHEQPDPARADGRCDKIRRADAQQGKRGSVQRWWYRRCPPKHKVTPTQSYLQAGACHSCDPYGKISRAPRTPFKPSPKFTVSPYLPNGMRKPNFQIEGAAGATDTAGENEITVSTTGIEIEVEPSVEEQPRASVPGPKPAERQSRQDSAAQPRQGSTQPDASASSGQPEPQPPSYAQSEEAVNTPNIAVGVVEIQSRNQNEEPDATGPKPSDRDDEDTESWLQRLRRRRFSWSWRRTGSRDTTASTLSDATAESTISPIETRDERRRRSTGRPLDDIAERRSESTHPPPVLDTPTNSMVADSTVAQAAPPVANKSLHRKLLEVQAQQAAIQSSDQSEAGPSGTAPPSDDPNAQSPEVEAPEGEAIDAETPEAESETDSPDTDSSTPANIVVRNLSARNWRAIISESNETSHLPLRLRQYESAPARIDDEIIPDRVVPLSPLSLPGWVEDPRIESPDIGFVP